MRTVSRSSWTKYITRLRNLSDKAADDLIAYIKNGHDPYADPSKNSEVIRYAYALATKYGEGATALAAEMYDALAVLSGKTVPPAVPAKTATYGEVAKAVNGTQLQSSDPNVMAGAIGRTVKMAGVDTIQQNALRDGAEWAWIPVGDTCAFCLMLASNGWQKASKRAIKGGHAEHIHANCDCTYAIRFSPDVEVEGYDPDTYKKMYDEAEGRDSKDKINYLRRQFYAENKGLVDINSPAAEEINIAKIRDFTPAKTRKEAETFAQFFADTVDYSGISLDNINIINEQLNILTSKYPINKLEYIKPGGSGVMSANYRQLNVQGRKLGKTLNDEELNFELSKAMAKSTIRQWETKYEGRKMPPHIEKIIKQQQTITKYDRWGVQSKYENHVKAVITHEYGHILSDQYFGMINKELANPNIKTNWSIKAMTDKWNEAYKKAFDTGDIYHISQYASKNVREFFAECFAMREMGDKLPDYIESLMAEVLKNGIMQ